MRIISGTLSGRKLVAPEGWTTRPMTDRVRGAVFNVLMHRDWGSVTLEGACVLDAFCGTGALSFESLSRGAAHAVLFDKDRAALAAARTNATSLGLDSRCKILSADTLAPPRAEKPCQLIFLAPPYRKDLVPPALHALTHAGWVAPSALLVIETAKKEELPLPENVEILVEKTWGDTRVLFATSSPVK